MTVGDRIAKIIKQEGIKRYQFAEKLKVNQAYISHIIYGKRSPSTRLMDDICEKFGVSRHWLETGEGDMYVESTAQTLDAITARYHGSPTFRAILDVYATLAPQDQDAVERYIRLLAQALEKGEPPELVRPDFGDVLDDLDSQADPAETSRAE